MHHARATHRLPPDGRAPRTEETAPPDVTLLARLQRSAGNAAVARLLAPRRVVARFEAGEHAQMGGDRTITITAGDGGLVELTEGELIALGDFYETPADMLSAPTHELTELRRLIRQDQMAFEGVPGAEPVTTDEWKDAMRHREEGKGYFDLLEDNAGHFAPPSDGSAGDGEDHRTLFFSNHYRALAMAHAAGRATGAASDEAIAVNGFACHFLTDAFSAGHLFNKAEMLASVEEAWKAIAAGWKAPNTFTDGVAQIVLADPDAAAKLARYRLDVGMPGFAEDITPANFSSLLARVAYWKPDQFYNVILNLVHDRLDHAITEPGHGIEVRNARGDTWLLAGDDTLDQSPETLRLSQEAVAQSFRNLDQAAQSTDMTADPQMAELVWDYTPRPTTSGVVVMNNLIAEMLNLSDRPVIEAFAAKSIENLDVAITELVAVGYLVERPAVEEPDDAVPEPSRSYVPSPPREDYVQSHARR